MESKGKRYFPVIYLRNGDACVGSPCETEAECKEALERAVLKTEPGKVVATTYMVRSDATTKEIFGSPNSRNYLTGWGKGR